MSFNVFWFIPTHGDSRYLGTSQGARPVDADYLRQVAVAADTLGYDGVLLPTGRSCEDAWVVASSLISVTQKLKFLVAVRPGLWRRVLAGISASVDLIDLPSSSAAHARPLSEKAAAWSILQRYLPDSLPDRS